MAVLALGEYQSNSFWEFGSNAHFPHPILWPVLFFPSFWTGLFDLLVDAALWGLDSQEAFGSLKCTHCGKVGFW